MGDELRVTVVATGLSQVEQRIERPDVRLVVNAPPQPAAVSAASGAAGSGTGGYKQYDTPTVMRQQPRRDETLAASVEDDDYLDIPAFLRRQAD